MNGVYVGSVLVADRDPRYFDDVPDDDGDVEPDVMDRPVPPQPAPRRRRARMGQVVRGLGRRATAQPGTTDFAKTVAQRARVAKGQELTTGGQSKGEQRGYGATATPGGST